MDLVKILAELVTERNKIDEAIEAIRKLERKPVYGMSTGTRKRGRPFGSRNRVTPFGDNAPEAPPGESFTP